MFHGGVMFQTRSWARVNKPRAGIGESRRRSHRSSRVVALFRNQQVVMAPLRGNAAVERVSESTIRARTIHPRHLHSCTYFEGFEQSRCRRSSMFLDDLTRGWNRFFSTLLLLCHLPKWTLELSFLEQLGTHESFHTIRDTYTSETTRRNTANARRHAHELDALRRATALCRCFVCSEDDPRRRITHAYVPRRRDTPNECDGVQERMKTRRGMEEEWNNRRTHHARAFHGRQTNDSEWDRTLHYIVRAHTQRASANFTPPIYGLYRWLINTADVLFSFPL